MIRIENLSREYKVGGEKVHALQQVNLEIPNGDYVSIMGPSGSGKSTLLHLIGCLDRPTNGRYLFAGRDVSSLSADELADIRSARIGFVFQNFNLLARISAHGSYEAFQHFIIEAPWTAEQVWRRLRVTIPDREGVLILDGTSFPKQGTHSVGVARQYCGTLGKIANCQMAVTTALWTGARAWN